MDRLPDREADRPWQWRRGNPGRPTNAERRLKVEAEAELLAEPFGGLAALEAADRVLLLRATEMLMRRPKNSNDIVRMANAAGRIISGLRKRHSTVKHRRSSNWLVGR
jgi:hypothetical protein